MNTNYTKMLEKTMPWTNAQVRNFQGPLEYYSVFNSFEAASAYALTGDVSYEGQVIAVIENGKTTVYVLDSASATGLKAVGSTTWQYFASEEDAVEYLSSDDAKEGEVVSLSTNTGYNIYKINDLDATTFADGYEKIIAQSDLDSTLENYVERSEISALSNLDADIVDRLIEITEDIDSELSVKADVSAVENSITEINTTIGEVSAATLEAANDYTDGVSAAIDAAYKAADEKLSTDLTGQISATSSDIVDYVDEVNDGLTALISSVSAETLTTANDYTDDVSAAIDEAYKDADEALSTALTGQIATAKSEAITAANNYTDNAISGLDYNPIISDDDTNTIYVVHNVTQEDGLITTERKAIAVSPSYETHKGKTVGALATIADISSHIADLGHVLDFQGVVTVLPPPDTYEAGDVLIVNSDELSNAVEYVLVEETVDGVTTKSWVKLGDESSYVLKGTALSDQTNGLTGNLPQNRVEGLPETLAQIEDEYEALSGRVDTLEAEVDGLTVISADHEGRIAGLEEQLPLSVNALLEDIAEIDSGYKSADEALSNALTSQFSGEIDALEGTVNTVSGNLDKLEEAVSDISTDQQAYLTHLSDEVSSLEGRVDILESEVDGLQAISADHEGRIDTLDTDVSEISGKVDEKIYVADQIANVSGYVETLNIHKVNNEQYAAALEAGIASSDIYIVNDENLDAYGRRITNVATPSADTDATNKAYVDNAIATATPATATNTSLGIVQGSTSVNGVSVDNNGVMGVNTITANKLVDSTEFILVLDGGNATGQNSAPTV